jgi:hypothetical protein
MAIADERPEFVVAQARLLRQRLTLSGSEGKTAEGAATAKTVGGVWGNWLDRFAPKASNRAIGVSSPASGRLFING